MTGEIPVWLCWPRRGVVAKYFATIRHTIGHLQVPKKLDSNSCMGGYPYAAVVNSRYNWNWRPEAEKRAK